MPERAGGPVRAWEGAVVREDKARAFVKALQELWEAGG